MHNLISSLDSLHSFLAAITLNWGRYDSYIWSCYILAFVMMGGMTVITLRRLKKREAELDALEAQQLDRGPRPAAPEEESQE